MRVSLNCMSAAALKARCVVGLQLQIAYTSDAECFPVETRRPGLLSSRKTGFNTSLLMHNLLTSPLRTIRIIHPRDIGRVVPVTLLPVARNISRSESVLPHIRRDGRHGRERRARHLWLLLGRGHGCSWRLVVAGLHARALLRQGLTQDGRRWHWLCVLCRWRGRLLGNRLGSKGRVPLCEDAGRVPDRCCLLLVARDLLERVRLLICCA